MTYQCPKEINGLRFTDVIPAPARHFTNHYNVTGEKSVIGDNEFDEDNKNIPKCY